MARQQNFKPTSWAAFFSLAFLTAASAEKILYTTSVNTCTGNSSLSAHIFSATLTPANQTVAYDASLDNSFSGKVTLGLSLTGDGDTIFHSQLDPCSSASFAGLCPASSGLISIVSNLNFPAKMLDKIPDRIFTKKDLHASFRLEMQAAASGKTVGCLEAKLSNGVGANATTGGSPSATSSGDAGEPTTTSEGNGSGNASGSGAAGSAEQQGGNGAGMLLMDAGMMM